VIRSLGEREGETTEEESHREGPHSVGPLPALKITWTSEEERGKVTGKRGRGNKYGRKCQRLFRISFILQFCAGPESDEAHLIKGGKSGRKEKELGGYSQCLTRHNLPGRLIRKEMGRRKERRKKGRLAGSSAYRPSSTSLPTLRLSSSAKKDRRLRKGGEGRKGGSMRLVVFPNFRVNFI